MRVVYSYFTAVAIAFASICVQGATTEQDQQAPMALKNVADAPAPVTSEYFAILDRSFKAAEAMAAKPTKMPVTPRPSASRPPTRTPTAKPSVPKPTRRPTQPKPTRKPTAATSAPTSTPSSSPSKKEVQDPLLNDIQPTDMPTAIPRHGGRFWTLDPSSSPTPEPSTPDWMVIGNHVEITKPPTEAPSYLERQSAHTNQVITAEPTQAPTQPPNEIPKHGGIFWAFPVISKE